MDEKRKELETLLAKIEVLNNENNQKFKQILNKGEVSLGLLMEIWETKDRLSKLTIETSRAIILYDSLKKLEKSEEPKKEKDLVFEFDLK